MSRNHEFTVRGSETVYSGAILELRRDRVEMPGGVVAERAVLATHGAAVAGARVTDAPIA